MIDAVKAELIERSSRGLADAFSRAVRAGAIVPGERLPSIRTVAKGLDLSPTTVGAAWRTLARANLIHTDGARGTFVVEGAGEGPARLRRALQHTGRFEIDLSSGLPDPALLPELRPSLGRMPLSGTLDSFLSEPIVPELRDLLKSDWPAKAELITMADGATDALDLIAMTFLQFGDHVAVEDPSYPPLLDMLEAAGARIVPMEVDESGPIVPSLSKAIDAGVRAIFLQPRAQIPTGACLTEERRGQLAAALQGKDVIVVEFDLAAAVASTPLVTIGEHVPGSTIHVRAYSASHGPDLRLAAVGGPASLMEPLIRRRHRGQGWTSRLLQHLLFDLITQQAPKSQITDARHTYARRRQALVSALADHGVRVGGKDGIIVWVPVEHELAALMLISSHGIGVAPGSPYLIQANAKPHIAVTAGLLPEDQASDIAAVLAKAAKPLAPSSIH